MTHTLRWFINKNTQVTSLPFQINTSARVLVDSRTCVPFLASRYRTRGLLDISSSGSSNVSSLLLLRLCFVHPRRVEHDSLARFLGRALELILGIERGR